MTLTYTQKKLIVFFKNRLFTDLICWTILFLLIIGTLTVDLWRQSEGMVDALGNSMSFSDFVNERSIADANESFLNAFQIIAIESLLFLIGMMIVVYFNLIFLKKRLLNTRLTKWERYGWYLSSVIILSLALGLLWTYIGDAFSTYFRTDIQFLFASIVNFGAAILSTGMLMMKELKDARAQVNNLRKEIAVIKIEQEAQQQENKQEDLTFYTNHIKVGSKKKWQIVPYEDIYFFKGGGNDPQIFTKTGKIWGSSKLEEYNYFLPKDKFIRVHRSYIIAKEWVRERDGNTLYLANKDGIFLTDKEGEKLGVPISESYMKQVEEDAFLMFEQEITVDKP
ncbi:MAG: DNA-binding LytR/AlgR family response regulator [Paraglaciecola sp.]|jgi:DNA-binding LytR/AlgR family response regulator